MRQFFWNCSEAAGRTEFRCGLLKVPSGKVELAVQVCVFAMFRIENDKGRS